MKHFWTSPLALTLTVIGTTQAAVASESVRVWLPETPEQTILYRRLSSLESQQGEFRQDFVISFPATRKLAVKIAVYRNEKLDTSASGLFHIYGIPNSSGDPKMTNAGSFGISRIFPQPPDKPRNGETETSWYVTLPDYGYGFREKYGNLPLDSGGSFGSAETAALRRGAVIMKESTDKFRLSVWVQTVPRLKSDPRYGSKRFSVSAPPKKSRR